MHDRHVLVPIFEHYDRQMLELQTQVQTYTALAATQRERIQAVVDENTGLHAQLANTAEEMAARRVAVSTSAASAAAMAAGGGGGGGFNIGAGMEGTAQVTVRQWTDVSQCLDLTQKELVSRSVCIRRLRGSVLEWCTSAV